MAKKQKAALPKGISASDLQYKGSPLASLPDAFSSYYKALFPGRWERLEAALCSEEPKTAFSEGLIKPYYMSPASLAAAKALFPGNAKKPPENARILDMCAAPGGKALVLAASMGESCELVANELSAARRSRLANVLGEHLPEEKRRRVRIAGLDAARWSRRERECFDLILLDAPCSSERHVMASAKSLAQWTPARVRNLSARQWALLSCAWLLLKPGGRLVYCTCALSPAENSGVVERLFKKCTDCRIFFPTDEFYAQFPARMQPEALSRGTAIFPDASCGIGPIFFSVLEKEAKSPQA